MKEYAVIEVHICLCCPYRVDFWKGDFCCKKANRYEKELGEKLFPDWCPLMEEKNE